MFKQNRKTCKAIDGLTEYNQKFKDTVKPCLLLNSNNHCSYCDEHFFNNGNLIIEHFKSRAEFSDLKPTNYFNLYASCNSCNSRKRDKNYSATRSLKPDCENYNFDKYFYFEPDTGKIIVDGYKRNIAQHTIDFLNLNNPDLKKARRKFWKIWIKNNKRPDESYRFIELF